jgi:hypothetical protein
VDASLMRLRPVGVTLRNAVAIQGFAQQQLGLVTPMLSGAATVSGDSLAAAQVLFGATALPPWSNRMPFEIEYVVALYGIVAGDRGQSRTIFARQHIRGDRGGYWAGGAFSWIDRTSQFHANEADAGAWLLAGRTRLTASLSTTRTDDNSVFEGTSLPPDLGARHVRVGDATLKFEYSGKRIETELLAGNRRGLEGSRGMQSFATVSAGVHVSRMTQIVLSGGKQLGDPLRGTPEWRFASLGVRLTSVAEHPAASRGRVGPPLTATRVDSTFVTIHIDAPAGARSVEVVGTFTRWEPMSLVRDGDGWSVVVKAAAGPHQVQVRIDGGDWRPPANLPSVGDEFGQRSGLIVIP